MLMFICLKTKNIVSSEGLHLSDWFHPFSLKDTIEKETFIFVFPWYVEFKVFGVWKLHALLEDPARTA